MAYPIIRLDKINASYNGNIESVVHTEEMTNGMIFNLGELVTGETELFKVAVPSTETLGSEEILLIASPEVVYEAGKGLKDFNIPAGKVARAYHLTVGDIFTITVDGIDGTTKAPAVGESVVAANASMKLTVADGTTHTTADKRFIGKIIEKTTLGYDGTEAYAIQIKRI